MPILQKAEALDWLHAQNNLSLPRCFFSSRSEPNYSEPLYIEDNNEGSNIASEKNDLVSVAGIGSAVFFREIHPFSFDDWSAIKRYFHN